MLSTLCLPFVPEEEELYPVAASRGAWGRKCPPVGGSAPHLPPKLKKKMVKISHFRQIFGYLPPQNCILPPGCPPQKISGAATSCISSKRWLFCWSWYVLCLYLWHDIYIRYSFIIFRYFHPFTSTMIHLEIMVCCWLNEWRPKTYSPLGCRWIMSTTALQVASGFIIIICGDRLISKFLSFYTPFSH